jgi:adenylate cyclase
MVRHERRLAAIVAAGVVGYSRLMGGDESGTLAALKAHRRELIDPKIAEYGGRIVKTTGDDPLLEFPSFVDAVRCAVGRIVKSTGDGLLLEFPSFVDAVRCAVDMRGMAERNVDVAADRQIAFRIGINVGDIIDDGDDIYRDGVNVAARLQALAEPGEICVLATVRDQAHVDLGIEFDDFGERLLGLSSRVWPRQGKVLRWRSTPT